jgi:D-alanine-D-alanine ligase
MIKVIVLMGGRTPEHEISLISGREVVKNLDPKKYQVIPVVISRDGLHWQLIDKSAFLQIAANFTPTKPETDWQFAARHPIPGPQELKKLCDVIFPAMHGPFGEDGTIQGLLKLFDIPYAGPGVLASSLGMDKLRFRKLMQSEGVPIPQFTTFQKDNKIDNIPTQLGPPPYFIKPHNQGSSVGASLVKNLSHLQSALNLALKYSHTALIDKYLNGTEVTCGIMGNENPEALPLVEIIPAAEYFDYQSKYADQDTQEIVPARISDKLTKQVQDLSLKVHQALSCHGFSRVDFIIKGNKDPICLEINTIPGLTPMSLLPQAAAAAGYSYPQMLDHILQLALE